jgi:hypothetical protein
VLVPAYYGCIPATSMRAIHSCIYEPVYHGRIAQRHQSGRGHSLTAFAHFLRLCESACSLSGG